MIYNISKYIFICIKILSYNIIYNINNIHYIIISNKINEYKMNI